MFLDTGIIDIKKGRMQERLLPPFWGKSDEEGYFILSGKGVETVGHGTFEIEKYDAIYLPVNTVHIVKNNGHEQ